MKRDERQKLILMLLMFIMLSCINVNVKAQGRIQCNSLKKMIFKERKKTIIVDPGHNYGREDTGARATHEGVLYIERDLNMAVSIALKYELENLGYNVILTRQPWQREVSSLNDSLDKRINIGNTSDANLFVSIHHDGNKNGDMCGVSAFYSSWKPAIDEGEEVPGYCCPRFGKYEFTMSLTPTKEAIIGKEVARDIVNELSNKLHTNNMGAHDRNLRVTKVTKIPAVLVECGFVTNIDEVKRCSNIERQKEVAKIIADVIGNYILIV